MQFYVWHYDNYSYVFLTICISCPAPSAGTGVLQVGAVPKLSRLSLWLVWLWHHQGAVKMYRYGLLYPIILGNKRLKWNWQLFRLIGTRVVFCYRFQPIRVAVGRTSDQEHSSAQHLILPSSIGNGSGKRKAESPKAVAPTTAGPGYHLAPGNIAESRRRLKPLPTSSNNEQRGRDTATTAAACCRCGEPIQPGSRSFCGG